MHILAGYLPPSAGDILLDGEKRHFTTPADALKAGIGMVRQHPNPTPGFKVWEDCILGIEPRRGPFLDRKKARNRVYSLSEGWGFDLPLEKDTRLLTVSQRQKAAILALLLREVRYLIFDEPTAILTPGETAALFRIFALLKEQGKGIVLISHKLDETLSQADRVTVLRKGKNMAERPASFLTGESLSALMFGIDREAEENTAGLKDESHAAGKSAAGPKDESVPDAGKAGSAGPFLRVRNLSVELPGRPFIRGLNMECCFGKILGIAGVRDSGLETLELALTGFLKPSGGKIQLGKTDITGDGITAFRRAGGAYLNTGRTGGAVALGLPIRDSLIIHAAERSRRGFWGEIGLMNRRLLDSWGTAIMENAQVTGSLNAPVESFSGGMLQRIILSREFAEKASLLILAEPGWGLDRASRDQLTRRLRDHARRGGAALLFSTDVDELISVSDEIFVLKNGEFSACLRLPSYGDRSRRDPRLLNELKEKIGQAMVGIAAGVPGSAKDGKIQSPDEIHHA
jgi:simple sugar transport system ATP-binding protein